MAETLDAVGALFRDGKLTPAIEAANAAVRKNPTDLGSRILLAELLLIFGSWVIAPGVAGLKGAPLPANAAALTNTRALGDLLYTRYIFAFQAAGVILLVAMIGAIVLTLRSRVGVRHQSISAQLARTRAEAVEIVKVPIGGGAGN